MGYLEDIEQNYEGMEVNEQETLNPLQIDYLRELEVSPETWEAMDKQSRTDFVGSIVERFHELNVPFLDDIKQWIGEIFGTEVKETYEQLEAPQDYIQIEQISDLLENCEELKFDNWTKLELSEKIDVLNELESRIAEIEHRPACPVRYDATMGEIEVFDDQVYGRMGGYSPDTKDITLNANLLESSDPRVYLEVIDTIVHEGRHAYQDYNINVCEVHPRHSEVESWAETMGDGKWGYWGDCSTLIGQRLYEQQSVEIDARNFAHDVTDKITDKLFA
jgi:hypothetical protein